MIDASVWMTGSETVLFVEELLPLPPLPQKSKGPPLEPFPPSFESPPSVGALDVTWMLRLRVETMPSVTVFDSPSGAPIATAVSPTLRSPESANVIGFMSVASILMTARSTVGSVPTSFAG